MNHGVAMLCSYVRVRLPIPARINGASSQMMTGFLMATDSRPARVRDERGRPERLRGVGLSALSKRMTGLRERRSQSGRVAQLSKLWDVGSQILDSTRRSRGFRSMANGWRRRSRGWFRCSCPARPSGPDPIGIAALRSEGVVLRVVEYCLLCAGGGCRSRAFGRRAAAGFGFVDHGESPCRGMFVIPAFRRGHHAGDSR